MARLLQVALELFLEQGIESTTIADITTAARVAKGSFYRYFDDKAALVKTLFAPLSVQVAGAFKRTSEAVSDTCGPHEGFEVYASLGSELTQIALQDVALIRLYLQENRVPTSPGRQPIHDLAQQIGDDVIALTKQAQEHGLLREFPPEVSALGVVGAVERILYGVLTGESFGNPGDIGKHITSLVLDGLRPRQ